MQDNKLQAMLDFACQTARLAGQMVRRELGRAKTEYKPGYQIVTEIDRRSQAMIIDAINQRWQGHGFIAEEGRDGKLFKQPPTSDDGIWWVIDPIDGTRNYAHGLPYFVVSIAAMQNGMPILGVIYNPNTDELFYGSRVSGAYCNGVAMHCWDEGLDYNSQIAICAHFGDSMPGYIDELMKRYPCMNLGTAALHYAYVARGAFAAALSYQVKLWDIAAGAVLCQCAGGKVSSPEAKALFPFDCNGYQGEAIPILVSGTVVYEQLLKLFAEHK